MGPDNESRTEAQRNGSDFEKEISKSFDAYFQAGVAHLSLLPLPTVPTFWAGRALRQQNGESPFDVYGCARRRFIQLTQGGKELGIGGVDVAVMIGAELKTTAEPKKSLSIVAPKSEGSGVEYHQLFALQLLAKMGGIVRLVWNNGGQVGVIREEKIIVAFEIYEQSRLLQERGKGMGPRGSRSIAWDQFEPVDYASIGGTQCLHWLKLESQ